MEDKENTQQQKNTVTIKKTTVWKALSGILFLLLLASIYTSGFGLFDKSPTGGTVIDNPQAQPSVPEPNIIDTSKWDLSGEPMLGKENAPIEIIIFDDFECPFCARFEQQAFPELKEKYIDTGKVKFIYQHFPLGFHAQAKPAAEATECANEEGKFWEMHGKIFTNQGSLSKESYLKWAEEIGLDVEKFTTCIEEGRYSQEVDQEFALGQQSGIQGTPSFLINGKLLVGAQPFEAFKQIIDAELG